MDIKDKSKKIGELMRNNRIFGTITEEHDGRGDYVAVEIIWGDWKHDHAKLEYLVIKNMPEIGLIETKTTEEDGSDCYSAIHKFFF